MFSLLIPTKGRVSLCKRCVDSAKATATGEVEYLLGVDENEAEAYQELGLPMLTFPEGHGGSWKVNRMQAYAKGYGMMFCGDDNIFRTVGWDKRLLDLLHEDPFRALYHKDDPKEHRGSCSVIVSRDWYEVAGYYPTYFEHFYGDTWLAFIAEKLGKLMFVDDVVIEHMHHKFGKSVKDSTYINRPRADPRTWMKTEPERLELVEKLRKVIDGRNGSLQPAA